MRKKFMTGECDVDTFFDWETKIMGTLNSEQFEVGHKIGKESSW